jgi:hypothetical protein
MDHSPLWPSVLLKYALATLRSGGMYQLPHLSFAMSGSPYASATRHTNSASSEMELSRLETDSVLLFRDARVEEKLVANSGKMISEVWIGFDIAGLMMIIVELKEILVVSGMKRGT